MTQRIAVAVAGALAVAALVSPGAAPVQEETPAVGMGTLTAESFQINLPLSWEEQDLSNQTFISPTPKDVRAHFRQAAPDGEGASVLFQYTAEPAPDEPLSREDLEEVIEEKRAGMAALAPEDFTYYVQDKGHGCLDGFHLLGSPETAPASGQAEHHVAFHYEYACSNGGVPTMGWAWVAYSPDGRKHNVFMTAYEHVWERDFATLQEVAASITLPE